MRGFHCVLEDLLRKHPEAQARGISLVVDLRDVGFANMDARIPKVLMPAMQSRLPVRLGRISVCQPPWFFRMIFASEQPSTPVPTPTPAHSPLSLLSD